MSFCCGRMRGALVPRPWSMGGNELALSGGWEMEELRANVPHSSFPLMPLGGRFRRAEARPKWLLQSPKWTLQCFETLAAKTARRASSPTCRASRYAIRRLTDCGPPPKDAARRTVSGGGDCSAPTRSPPSKVGGNISSGQCAGISPIYSMVTGYHIQRQIAPPAELSLSSHQLLAWSSHHCWHGLRGRPEVPAGCAEPATSRSWCLAPAMRSS